MNTQNRYLKNYLESLIKQKYIELRHQIAAYEKNRFNPESYQYSGIYQWQRAQRAEEKAQNAKDATIKDIKDDGFLSTCILDVARHLYFQAVDFNQNPFIKISNLKAVVILRNWHDENYPEGKIYSTKFLINVI